MATTTLSIPVQRVGKNGGYSGAANLPANTQEVNIQIVSPDWDTTTGTVSYRFEVRINGVWQSAGQGDNIVMGSRGKNNNMPIIGLASDILAQADQGRIWAACDPAIRIGGNVTIYYAG